VDGTNRSGLALTNRLTGTTVLGFDAVGAEIWISPVQVWGMVRPDVFTSAVMVLGVAPLSGDTTSQFPQEEVWAIAANPTLAPVLLVMENDCAAGALVPICHAKLSWEEPNWMAGVPATVTSTGTLIPFVPGGLIATAPLNGPGVVGSAAGFTVTCNPSTSVPDWGFTVSQFPPSLVLGVAVKVVRVVMLLASVTDWVAGIVLLVANGKLKEFGFAESALAPGNVSSSARTETEAPAALIFIKPSSVDRVERAGLTETVSCSGVVPLAGETCSQLLAEMADTATLVDPADDVTMMVCGDMVPVPAVNVSWVGLAVSASGPFWQMALSEKHTRAINKLLRQTRDFSAFCTSSSTKNCAQKDKIRTRLQSYLE
jgi:hypothetical protein